MEFARTRRKIKSLNLTSLIDILFLLVVFFMLTSEFVKSEMLSLSVSSVDNGKASVSTDEAIIVILAPDKKFIIAGKEYDVSLLRQIMGNLIKENKQKEIVLISKKYVTVQDLVFVMDEIKALGGNNISLAGE